MTKVVQAQLEAGTPLGADARRWLLETPDLVQIGMLASEVRSRLVGETASFVRVDEIAIETVGEASPAPEAGEIRLLGAPGGREAAVTAVSRIAAAAAAPVTGFSLHDIAVAAGSDLSGWLGDLRTAGLAGVAEARLDRLDQRWLEAVAAAGLHVQTVAPGWPATGDAWVAALEQVALLQERYGVFRAFQPLPVDASVTEPSTGYDDMRAVATARLLLPAMPRLQVHWGRAGAKLAQACLLFGANDLDAVPARDPMPHGPRRAILEDVRRNIVAVGLTPVERDALGAPRRSSEGTPA